MICAAAYKCLIPGKNSIDKLIHELRAFLPAMNEMIYALRFTCI